MTRVERLWRPSYDYPQNDMLFVIDDGPSMEPVRKSLEAQWPAIADVLLHGHVGDDYVPTDWHVGVIGTDMGAGGDGFLSGCSARGEDGRLVAPPECGLDPTPYEWRYPGNRDDAASERAITCALGRSTGSCTVSQPLEALLKAILPAKAIENVGPKKPPAPEPMQFADGSFGHGMEANAGFLRTGDVWIVLITNQDDCSTRDPSLFTPPDQLEPDDPLHDIAPALRCFRAAYKLRAVREYVSALEQVRPRQWDYLHFVVVAGFPSDLVDEITVENLRSTSPLRSDEAPREAAYLRIKSDPRMQVQLRAAPMPGESTFMPSCQGASFEAYPPNRLFELAYELGSQARIASICNFDLAKILKESIYPKVTENSASPRVCRLRARPRDVDGRVDCRATLELIPEADPTLPLTPSRCSDRPDVLQDPAPGFPTKTEDGNPLCEVRQAPVVRAADGAVTVDGPGWYYYEGDEADALGLPRCGERGHADYALTEGTLPIGPVFFRLECVDEDTTPECSDASAGAE